MEFNEARWELSEQKKMDRHDAQQAADEVLLQSVQEWEDSLADPAITAIRKITQSGFSERVAVQIIRALATKITESNWAHFEHAQDSIVTLDELSDELEVKQ